MQRRIIFTYIVCALGGLKVPPFILLRQSFLLLSSRGKRRLTDGRFLLGSQQMRTPNER